MSKETTAEKVTREIVQMSESNFDCADECYCAWYKCPRCEDTMITDTSNFCSECGARIVWEKNVLNKTTDHE